MKHKLTRVFILALAFVFTLQASGLAEVTDLREEGKFKATDALLAAFVGYITSSAPGPGATLYKVFASTYITPILTSQIIKAAGIKNRWVVMAMQLGLSAGIKGALLSGAAKEGVKAAAGEKVKETFMQATKRELKEAAKEFKKAFSHLATKQAAKAFASGFIRGAVYATVFRAITKAVETKGPDGKTKHAALARFLATSGALLAGHVADMAMEKEGMLPEGEKVDQKSFFRQYAISIAAGGAELGLKAAGLRAEYGILASAGLTNMLQFMMYRPPEDASIAEGEQIDKELALVEGVREGQGVEGKKITELTKAGTEEALDVRKLNIDDLSADQKTLLKEYGILKDDGTVDQKQLRKMSVKLQLEKADNTHRIEMARMSTGEAAFEGAKRAAISMALQYLSLKTKSPVHGAYLNLALTSLLKTGLIVLSTKGNFLYEIAKGEGEEGDEALLPRLTESKRILRFIDAQLGQNVGQAQGDFMTMGQYQVEERCKGEDCYLETAGPAGSDLFFMPRYMDYVMAVHDSGFEEATINQALSAVHNQSVGNLNDVVDATVGKFYNRSSPLVKLYYIDMRGASARQLIESAKKVNEAAKGTEYEEAVAGELKRVPEKVPFIGHGGPEQTLEALATRDGLTTANVAALNALNKGESVSQEDAARLKELGVLNEGVALKADEKGMVRIEKADVNSEALTKKMKLVNLRAALKENIALQSRAVQSYHSVSRVKTLEASFTRSELRPDATGKYPEYGQRQLALDRRVDEIFNEDAATYHSEAVKAADATMGIGAVPQQPAVALAGPTEQEAWDNAYNETITGEKESIRQGVLAEAAAAVPQAPVLSKDEIEKMAIQEANKVLDTRVEADYKVAIDKAKSEVYASAKEEKTGELRKRLHDRIVEGEAENKIFQNQPEIDRHASAQADEYVAIMAKLPPLPQKIPDEVDKNYRRPEDEALRAGAISEYLQGTYKVSHEDAGEMADAYIHREKVASGAIKLEAPATSEGAKKARDNPLWALAYSGNKKSEENKIRRSTTVGPEVEAQVDKDLSGYRDEIERYAQGKAGSFMAGYEPKNIKAEIKGNLRESVWFPAIAAAKEKLSSGAGAAGAAPKMDEAALTQEVEKRFSANRADIESRAKVKADQAASAAVELAKMSQPATAAGATAPAAAPPKTPGDIAKLRETPEWQAAYAQAIGEKRGQIYQLVEKEQQLKLDIGRGLIGTKRVYFDAWEKPEAPPVIPPPPPKPPTIESWQVVGTIDAFYDFARPDLSAADIQKITTNANFAKIVEMLKADSSLQVDISALVGSADIWGTEALNVKLGEQRAAQLKNILLEAGVPQDRITTVNLGKSKAKAALGDVAEKAKERRATITVSRKVEVEVPAGETAETASAVSKDQFLSVSTGTRAAIAEQALQRGQNLWNVARAQGYRGSVERLIEVNKFEYAKQGKTFNPQRMRAGDTVYIPKE